MTPEHQRTGDPLLDAERAEDTATGTGAAVDVQTALAAPGTVVVAVRTDGLACIRSGLPDAIDAASLDAPLLVGDVAVVVLDLATDTEAIAHLGRFAEPRSLLVGGTDLRDLLAALGFGQWRARTRFCARDGSRLLATGGGRVLRCERSGHEQFPRLEPAVIMRVTDDDDRILLGRQPGWPEGRFSVLAGFVDPGESLEDAVTREVMEEVGVGVTDVTYVRSQPWPFPASLMLGFSARATGTEITTTEEIAEARWLGRAGLQQAMDAGEVFLPPDISIAHRLVVDWFGGPLTSSWADQQPQGGHVSR